jgi:hypothetical protein
VAADTVAWHGEAPAMLRDQGEAMVERSSRREATMEWQ